MESELIIKTVVKPAVEFCCGKCGKIVRICRSCWRNQSYCSDDCSQEAKRERHCRDQKAYRMTKAGRENHIAHQKAYRKRQKKIQE